MSLYYNCVLTQRILSVLEIAAGKLPLYFDTNQDVFSDVFHNVAHKRGTLNRISSTYSFYHDKKYNNAS